MLGCSRSTSEIDDLLRIRPAGAHRLVLLCLLAVGGCAVEDSRIAQRGKTELLGLREVDLVSCLGGPDQHISFGSTDVLTYYFSSNSSLSYSPPVVGGFSVNNGGNCHVTVRVDGGVVRHVIYSGEKNATLAPDAYCAPILRSCLGELEAHPPARVSATTPVAPTSAAPAPAVPAPAAPAPASPQH
jgi:hypothetical protein